MGFGGSPLDRRVGAQLVREGCQVVIALVYRGRGQPRLVKKWVRLAQGSVVELADTQALGACAGRRPSSNLGAPTCGRDYVGFRSGGYLLPTYGLPRKVPKGVHHDKGKVACPYHN